MQTRELQSISRFTTRVDSLSFVSSLLQVTTLLTLADQKFLHPQSLIAKNRNLFLDSSSTESHIFYVERSSEDGSLVQNNTPAVLNSTQLSAAMSTETITISSVASPQPQTNTIDSDSNEPTIPSGFGHQHPIAPPSLNDLNLPPNPFNLLATMAVIQLNEVASPQSSEPSHPSPTPTTPMILSTIEGWETPHTITNDNSF